MKHTFFCILWALSLSIVLHADDSTMPAKHEYFKWLVGKWNASGELKGADGNVQPYKAEWTGTALEDGSVQVEGSRQIGDTTQSFRWLFSPGSAEGLFEATHVVTQDQVTEQRFEVSYSAATGVMEMSAFLGSDNSKITLKESFEKDSHDLLNTLAEFTDDQGNTTLTVTIKNERVKDA